MMHHTLTNLILILFVFLILVSNPFLETESERETEWGIEEVRLIGLLLK